MDTFADVRINESHVIECIPAESNPPSLTKMFYSSDNSNVTDASLAIKQTGSENENEKEVYCDVFYKDDPPPIQFRTNSIIRILVTCLNQTRSD